MVKRYDFNLEFPPVEDSCGWWVSIEDYNTLEDDFNSLKKSYDDLVERIGELYKGF